MSTPVETPATAEAAPEPAAAAEPVARWLGDLVSVLLLAAVLLYLEDHDGGLALRALRWVGVLAIVALPALVTELRKLPTWLVWLVALWVLGTIASVAFAQVRSGAVPPLLVHGIVPVVFLATRRLWSRSWGPGLLLGLLTLTLATYWHRSFLQWWGYTLNEQQPIWLALSWRNQSGILMGALGLVSLGVALRAPGVLRVAASLLTGASLAGVWLSSSRGSILVAGAAVVVLLLAAAWRDLRGTVVTAALVGALALATTAGLLAMDQRTEASSPLASRAQTVEHNGRARLFHMEAAAGMFVDRPLTGQGLGSYREMARPFTDPRANLTSSAHNQYAENLGEGGLLLGGAFLALSAAAAWAALGVLRRRPTGDPLRSGLQLGAAGVVLAVGAHVGLDFDWRYLVLPALFAMGAAVVMRDPADGPGSRAATWVTSSALAVSLLGAVLLASAQLGHAGPGSDPTPEELAAAPWPLDLQGHVGVGYALWRDGEVALAREVAERGLVWHPGATRLTTLANIARFELGELGADELAASVDQPWSRFDEYANVASSLIDAGELDLAADLLERQRDGLTTYAAWGVSESARGTWPVIVRLEAARGGCDAGEAAAARALDDELADWPDEVTAEDVLAAAQVDC